MKKIIIVAGYGPGISRAVAEWFGKEGFTAALVGRTESRLHEGVRALAGNGVEARAFAGDLGSADAARKVVARVRKELGPVSVLHWNAYLPGAGDLLLADPKELRPVLEIATGSLAAAAQEALPDLKADKGAILVTNGGLGLPLPEADVMGIQFNAMGLAIANAAKHKLVRLLHLKLKPDGVYVGEIMVTGLVKGTVFDQGNATLDPADIAKRFWEMYLERQDVSTTI
jgi:NAD(P)-dependent dehydrogenase (short-subunit alcohol dehydrogenase family)